MCPLEKIYFVCVYEIGLLHLLLNICYFIFSCGFDKVIRNKTKQIPGK